MNNKTNTICYEKVLTLDKLEGKKDCTIMFVKHKGNIVDLYRAALKKNICIESISMKTYLKAIGKKWWII